MDFVNDLKKICPDNLLYKKEDLYVYAYDTSQNPNDIILPLAVVYPKNASDVSKIVKYARKNKLNIIPRAQGTNHCGATRPIENSIVLHFSKMDKIIKIDKENLIAIVEPNVVIGDLNKELDKLNLFFPPDPSNLAVSTIGGAIALCAGGPRTFKYGNTKDYVINLEVVLSDGTMINTAKDLSKNVTGYNLTSLFTGSEGTLGIITKATLKLIPKPEVRLLNLAYFETLEDSAKCVNKIIDRGLIPSVIDLLDNNTIKTIEKFNPCGLLADKEAALLIELDGFEHNVLYGAEILKDILIKSGSTSIVQAKNEAENEEIWKARRGAYSAVTQLKPNVVTEDIVVPKTKIVESIKKIKEISDKYSITVCIMGHIGDGNIHPNFALDLSDEKEKNNFEKLKDELFNYAITVGGTLSGEHGIGTHKKKYLVKALDENSYNLMKNLKKFFDSDNILNREKMF